jgi:UDP-N-acetylmuramyl pentapeptide phosphotransferase/UDP-N-acetylglucosamine-1-phosphate transferase
MRLVQVDFLIQADGLDGLATGCTVTVASTYAILGLCGALA